MSDTKRELLDRGVNRAIESGIGNCAATAALRKEENQLWQNPSKEEIAALLRRSRKIAIVGLSPNPSRPSHDVARYLKAAGYEITGVRPGQTEILGEPCFRALRDIPAARRPDIVNIFRRADQAGVHVREAVELGFSAIWMQLGVVDEEAAKAAAANGVLVVMDRCIAVDHRRLP